MKTTKIVAGAIFGLFLTFTATAQTNNVGIGTTNPKPTAILDLESTTQGLLPPRMSHNQKKAINNPEAGLMIYCTDCGPSGQLQFFNGTLWADLVGGTSLKGPTVQDRLNSGEKAISIFDSGIPLDSLYGKTYQGGIIAYLNTTTGAGFVAAAIDQGAATSWQTSFFTTSGATSTTNGSANTDAIIAQTGGAASNTYAAGLCRLYSAAGDGGLNDWYLPAQDELDLIWNNLADADGNNANSGPADPNNLGGFASNKYWSSTEESGAGAYYQSFSNGTQNPNLKGLAYYVRAMRAFDDIPSIQERLVLGETPKQIFDSGIPLDSLYGKTYQGGIIAYLNTTTGAGFVAAAIDQGAATSWQTSFFTTSGATSTTNGSANTDAIIAQTGGAASNTYAAGLCRLYSAAGDGGLNDWYLPAQDELDLIWNNLADADGNNANSGPADPNNLGGFASNKYWSSTEESGAGAYYQSFSNGTQNPNLKGLAYHVRAVRAF